MGIRGTGPLELLYTFQQKKLRLEWSYLRSFSLKTYQDKSRRMERLSGRMESAEKETAI